MNSSKLKLGVIFGGVSPEHEISILTALQMIEAVDTTRYEIIPIYISTKGSWHTGKALYDPNTYKKLPGSLNQAREIVLLPRPYGHKLVYVVPGSANGKIVLEENADLQIDIAFLALHGTHGEDGAIQGLLTMAKIPFVGSGIRSSAITMSKWIAKVMAKAHNIPTLPAYLARKMDFLGHFEEQVEKVLQSGISFPVIVKPNNLGSSVGLNFANNKEELKKAIVSVFKLDAETIIEPRVMDLLEINVSVFGRVKPRASVIEVPLSNKELLTFEKKYIAEGGGKKGPKVSASSGAGMANLKREINSMRIPEEMKEKARDMAVKLFAAMDCGGVVRIDFIVDNATGELYFNELNSIPGSFSFYLWVNSSPRYLLTELIDTLVDEALHEFGLMQTLEQIQSFQVLK